LALLKGVFYDSKNNKEMRKIKAEPMSRSMNKRNPLASLHMHAP